MEKAVVFDIKEFAINDGPGIRLTIFFKGCSLRCKWCHNPEGLSKEKQLNKLTNRIVGKDYDSDELAQYIRKFKDLFDSSGGGVTFSGGEPADYADFIFELLPKISNIHVNLDTSGYCPTKQFEKLFNSVNLIFFDIKLADGIEHEKWTGISNEIILNNLFALSKSDIPFHIRIPLIPDITDTADNFCGIERIIKDLPRRPHQIDLLPYNILAGGKYGAYNSVYPLANTKQENNLDNIKRFIGTMNKFSIILN